MSAPYTDPYADPAAGPRGLRTRSLRRRVTAVVLIFIAAMLVVLGLTTSLVLSARLEGEVRQRLTDRASYAAVLVGTLDAQDLVDRLEGDGVSVRLRTSSGQLISRGALVPTGTTTPSQPPAPGGGPKGGPAAPVQQQGDVLSVTRSLSDGSVITLWASVADARRTLDQVRLTMAVAGLVLLALSAVVLGPVIGRALSPLDEITATARSISAGDRGRRLRPDRPDTELGRTATAFDEMLDEVEGAERQARSAEGQLRGFLSDAAHELRTPLTGIHAAAERLLRADLDRVGRERVSVTLIRESRRAGRLVDDMLTMTRIDRGLDLVRRPADVTALATQVAETTRITHPGARVEVVGHPAVLDVDADRVTQVLVNLVGNSLAAGHGTPSVRLSVSSDPRGVLVDVTDTGVGVPPGQRERIFDRLVRLDPSRTGGGSGLGLSIARGIARAHGGDLVCLDPGPTATGAWFRLTLPR